MNEGALLECSTAEYECLLREILPRDTTQVGDERIAQRLSLSHDWTEQGAETVVQLARDYGAFMLRNALALAIALGIEDGRLGH